MSIERPLEARNTAQTAAQGAAQTVVGGPEAPVKGEVAETPLEAMASICTILAIGMFVFGFIFQNFEIPSGSMLNTLLIGDHVVVDRITLAPADQVGSVGALSAGEAGRHYCVL